MRTRVVLVIVPLLVSLAVAGLLATRPSTTPNVEAAQSPAVSPYPSWSPRLPATPAVVLQETLDRLRASAAIPGVSATLSWSDGGVWTGTSGLADVGAGIAVMPETAFSVASVSKTFVAALILELVEEGQLSLDDSAARFLTDLGLDPRITVRQLLGHTSGLADYFLNPAIDRVLQRDPGRAWSAADALRYVQKARFPPGTDWYYSNTNYVLLGLIAEHVTGRSVAVEIRERFLAPLGLRATYYQALEAPTTPAAHAYRFESGALDVPAVDLSDGSAVVPFTSVVTAAGAAGSIASSSPDLATWARALYGGTVLSEDALKTMLAAQSVPKRPTSTIPYGLGTQEFSIGRWRSYGHSGRFLGARAVMRYLPEQRLAIAVVTNQSRSDPNLILEALLNVALPPLRSCEMCR